ncbi:hypothetical protein AB205_0122710 [Aquarana catesbeiana]|uniref:Uncharacterized protein n=1 Tax=Aquarana catesbeiana TaxID=8400 RepID=A0A2G9RUY6_AQUCT|nr:hypothetical protein AB205_0122710 [Aquarana catesbeiana]
MVLSVDVVFHWALSVVPVTVEVLHRQLLGGCHSKNYTRFAFGWHYRLPNVSQMFEATLQALTAVQVQLLGGQNRQRGGDIPLHHLSK